MLRSIQQATQQIGHHLYSQFFPLSDFELLIKAILRGDKSKLEEYNKHKGDLNVKNDKGDTLLLAVYKEINHISFDKINAVVDTLLYILEQPSLDINAANTYGNTFLHLFCIHSGYIANQNFYDVVKQIIIHPNYCALPNKNGILPVCAYLTTNYGHGVKAWGDIDPQILELLLENTKDINVRDNKGKAFIHYLGEMDVHEFNLEQMTSLWKMVLNFNPDLNQVDQDGNHVLDKFEVGIMGRSDPQADQKIDIKQRIMYYSFHH